MSGAEDDHWTVSPKILLRRYDDGPRVTILMIEEETGAVHVLEQALWPVLEAADGTRNVAGICAAARRAGADLSLERTQSVVEQLRELGVLVASSEARRSVAARPATTLPAGAWPLERLPSYRFHCDGSGGCCRSFHSMVFSPQEEERARAIAVVARFERGVDTLPVFTPLIGGHARASCVAMRRGRCGFLSSEDGLCELHRYGGPQAKPWACRSFPARRIVDGIACRVTPRPECACVFASGSVAPDKPTDDVARPGEALHHDADTTAGLPFAASIEHLQEARLDRGDTVVDRPTMRAWSAEVERVAEDADALELLRRAVTDAEAGQLHWPPRGKPYDIAEAVKRVADHAEALAIAQARFRAESDVVRQACISVAEAAALCCDEEIRKKALQPRALPDERLLLRTEAFGYGFATDGRPLCTVFLDYAVRMLMGRVMSITLADRGPAFAHPLAWVNVLFGPYRLAHAAGP